MLSQLHGTKYKRDNPPCIVQALPPAPKIACYTACRAQFSTLCRCVYRFRAVIYYYETVVGTSVVCRGNGCGDLRYLLLLLVHFLMLNIVNLAFDQGRPPTTAPRLGNAVSAGHRPRLVTLESWSNIFQA